MEETEKKPVNKNLIIGIVAAVIVVIAVVLILVFVFNGKDKDGDTNVKHNGPVANTQAEVVKDIELGGLKFSNIALITDDTTSFMTMDVTNPTDALIKMQSVDIVLKDKDGKVLTTFLGYFGGEVPAGETRTISSQTEMDLTKASTKEVTITNPQAKANQ